VDKLFVFKFSNNSLSENALIFWSNANKGNWVTKKLIVGK